MFVCHRLLLSMKAWVFDVYSLKIFSRQVAEARLKTGYETFDFVYTNQEDRPKATSRLI